LAAQKVFIEKALRGLRGVKERSKMGWVNKEKKSSSVKSFNQHYKKGL